MALSMTGFGRGVVKKGEINFVVEVRSLNNRFCEVHIHAPKGFLEIEYHLTTRLRETFDRGKFDVVLRAEHHRGAKGDTAEDEKLVSRWKKLERIRKKLKIEKSVPLEAVLTIPSSSNGQELIPDPNSSKYFLKAANEAFRRLEILRAGEGKALVADISKRVFAIGKVVDRIERAALAGRPERLTRMRERITELIHPENMDRNRMETELALLVERGDVTEEIVRLKSHLKRLEKFLISDGSIGRNIDFLLQEIHRETNTIGSKAADLQLTGEVLFMKSEIEKIREQAQNLE